MWVGLNEGQQRGDSYSRQLAKALGISVAKLMQKAKL